MIEKLYGVWANKNCELIQTEKFALFFRRHNNCVFATMSTIYTSNNQITFQQKGHVIYNSSAKTVAYKIADLDSDKIILEQSVERDMNLVKFDAAIEREGNSLKIYNSNNLLEELSPEENTLKLSLDGGTEILKLVEPIEITEPRDAIVADQNNVGQCLIDWSLGSSIETDAKTKNWGLSISTQKHTYTFANMILEGNMDLNGSMVNYCRAARIKACNLGMVFAQNIRLMNNPREFTVRMYEDNFATTSTEIEIDNSLFNPEICVKSDQGIYWSVKSFTKDKILLHGCGGDEYSQDRPTKDSSTFLERFKST